MTTPQGDDRELAASQGEDEEAEFDDSEIDFDDEREDDQDPLDVTEAEEADALLDDPEQLDPDA